MSSNCILSSQGSPKSALQSSESLNSVSEYQCLFLEYCLSSSKKSSLFILTVKKMTQDIFGMAVLFFIKVTSKIVNSFLFWPGLPKFIVNNLLGIPQRGLNYSKVESQLKKVLHFQGQTVLVPEPRDSNSSIFYTKGHFLLNCRYCSMT